MQWDEEISHPKTHELVQRRAYIFGDDWSWLLLDAGDEMTLTDNPGDFRVRQSPSPQALARAEKAPSRLGKWTVTFPDESSREPYVAGPRDDAIIWMRTALHFDPHADEATRSWCDPERVARQFGIGHATPTEAEQEEGRRAAQAIASMLRSSPNDPEQK